MKITPEMQIVIDAFTNAAKDEDENAHVIHSDGKYFYSVVAMNYEQKVDDQQNKFLRAVGRFPSHILHVGKSQRMVFDTALHEDVCIGTGFIGTEVLGDDFSCIVVFNESHAICEIGIAR